VAGETAQKLNPEEKFGAWGDCGAAEAQGYGSFQPQGLIMHQIAIHAPDRRDLFAMLGGAAGALGFFALAGTARASQPAADDIALLREALTTLHPGLYRYSSPRGVAGLFDRLDREWNTAADLRARFLALSRMLAALQCGHSYANFYNQAAAVQQQLFTDIPRLPFLFRWLGGEMVVLASQGAQDGIAPGTIVTKINGISTRDILARLLPYVRADGGNDGKRVDLLGCTGRDRWETFDIFFANLYPEITTYTLDLLTPDGRKPRAIRAPITLTERQTALAATGKDNDAPAWTLAHDPAGHAILTMPGWALYNSKWDWRAFLDQCFTDMAARGTTGLVIDLRNNEGGLDCGDEILARLIDAPLSPETYERRVRFRTVPDHLLKYMDTWDPGFAKLGEAATPRAGGFFALPDGAVERIEPKGPRFCGKVSVITDPGNSSATWRFAAIVKAAKLGTLVGGTTGGNQRGINGGAFYFLRLPASGLAVDVPLIGSFPRTPKPDAGVDPDIRVAATARDIAAGRDPVLAAAIKTVT
jgi:Peptidase family S41